MSLKEYVLPLLRPDVAFDGWRPDGDVIAGIVLLCCVASAASVAVAGDAVAGEVDGTVTVENPSKPSEWVCNGANAEHFDCDAPATVERSLHEAAATAVDGPIPKAVVVPLAWILFIAALVVVVSGHAGGRDGEATNAFTDAVGIATVAAVPGLLRAAARPLAVERGLADFGYPASLDGVRTAAVDALFPDGALWLAAVAVSGPWAAAVVYGGTRGAFDVGRKGSAAVATTAGLSVAGSVLLANGGWLGAPGAMGVLVVVGGVVGLVGARTSITISKTFELIGFSGGDRVEPKPWYVALHRLGAVAALAVGFLLLDGIALV